MTKNYRIGGYSHNSFDIDSYAFWLYIAVLDSDGDPKIIKIPAELNEDGHVSYSPSSGGDEINVQCAEISSYFVWASGILVTMRKLFLLKMEITGTIRHCNIIGLEI